MKITLDERGLLQSATVYDRSLTNTEGRDSLLDAALIAASSSEYSPEVRDCKPVGGLYLFTVNFN